MPPKLAITASYIKQKSVLSAVGVQWLYFFKVNLSSFPSLLVKYDRMYIISEEMQSRDEGKMLL